MSTELRLKKLRGSGGYVMAKVSDEQQSKGNLGGPDLFLAPVGRLDQDKITKYFCNTCEKEFEDSPKIDYESPNEVVAENLVLKERGQYVCTSCGSTLAEYREFSKQDEAGEVGAAKSLSEETAQQQPQQSTIQPQESAPEQTISPQEEAAQLSPRAQPQSTEATQPSSGSVSSIEGLDVYDESAKKIGVAKQLGIDNTQSLVLILTKNDGSERTIPWNKVKNVGEIILLGSAESQAPPQTSAGKCQSCGFDNKPESKFCEECGIKLQ